MSAEGGQNQQVRTGAVISCPFLLQQNGCRDILRQCSESGEVKIGRNRHTIQKYISIWRIYIVYSIQNSACGTIHDERVGPEMKKIIKRSETLQAQVYEYLREKILYGGIAPGQRLIEERIAEETGVSRSPIREAIRRLEKDGLVEVHAQGGVTVYKPTIEDFTSLYECRLSLEPAAAQYAAERRTEEQVATLERMLEEMKQLDYESETRRTHELNFAFHELIAEASKNPYLAKVMRELKVLISFYRNAILQVDPKRPETGIAEHTAIYEAILRKDGEAARRQMEEHIKSDFLLCMDAHRQHVE
jgi:DNA-binding GntR family transcriptional regulator